MDCGWPRLLHTVVLMALQQILCHRRHDGSREEVRCEHREDHRLRQRNEQIPRDAAKKEHRHKYDADCEGRNERRDRDLCGSGQNRVFDLLALFEIAVDVLDLHRRVVDENADRERKAAEGHDVDGLAQRRQHPAASR